MRVMNGQGWFQPTSNILVSWTGRVGAVSGFALSLMLRDRVRDFVRQLRMPQEPGLKASFAAWTRRRAGKNNTDNSPGV